MKTVFKNLYDKWKLNKPFALGLSEWNKWDAETKAKYPVRFFFQEDLHKWFHQNVSHTFSDMYWWVRYRTINRDYWIIKPRTLTPGWKDERTLILHGAFEVLTRYWEHHKKYQGLAWWPTEEELKEYDIEIEQAKTERDKEFLQAEKDSIVNQKVFCDEAHTLYIWWSKIRPNRELTLPKLPKHNKDWGILAFANEDKKNDPTVKEYKRVLDIHIKMKESWELEDDDMLIRLMKIRRGLWI